MPRAFATVVAAVAIAFVLLLAPAPAAAQTPADVPVHDVGHAAGFGTSEDIYELAAVTLARIRALDEADANFTIHEVNLTGSLDVWIYQEVVEEDATTYTIQEETAAGVRARFILDLTTEEAPVPGTYPCDQLDVPTEPRRSSVSLDLAHLVTTEGPSIWNVSDFALRESTTNSTFDLRITSSVRGVPSLEFNETACEITYAYEDRDLTITADIDAQIRVAYTPALDIFAFPIEDNETWWANASATVGGEIRGSINVVGLDPEDVEEFFTNLTEILNSQSGVSVTGLTGFPIILEDIRVTIFSVDYLENGQIHDYPITASQQVHARFDDAMTLADGAFHDVYLLAPPADPFAIAPGCSWVYSPDDGFIVGYVCEIAPGVPIFELENVPDQEARQEVDDTKVEYAVTPPAGNPLADFFLQAPFYGLILVAVAVLVVAAVLMRRRRPPAALPMPPEVIPPGGPPPEMPPPETP